MSGVTPVAQSGVARIRPGQTSRARVVARASATPASTRSGAARSGAARSGAARSGAARARVVARASATPASARSRASAAHASVASATLARAPGDRPSACHGAASHAGNAATRAELWVSALADRICAARSARLIRPPDAGLECGCARC
jgi:hypothetical protein